MLDRDGSADLEAVLLHYGMDYVPNKKNASVRCVFHDDAHASASVDLARGLYHCLSCGIGGDAVSLIQLHERKDFKHALEVLEGIAGAGDTDLRGGHGGKSSRGLPPKTVRQRYIPSWTKSD